MHLRIKSGRLFICRRHFLEDQILRHDATSLKPGVIHNVCFPPSSSKPRGSTANSFEKSLCVAKHDVKYLINHAKLLKLVGWEISTTDKTTHFNFLSHSPLLHLVAVQLQRQKRKKDNLTLPAKVNAPIPYKAYSAELMPGN